MLGLIYGSSFSDDFNALDTDDLRRNFMLYNIGTAFDLSDINQLIKIEPKNVEDSLHIARTALLMIEEIYSRWFGTLCTVGFCLVATQLVCSVCKLKICCRECKNNHNCERKLV